MPKSVKKTKKSTKKQVAAVVVTPLPGYWSFTKQVFSQLLDSKAIFLRLLSLLVLIVLVLTVIEQQAVYVEQATGIQSLSSELATGFVATLLETGVLFLTLISGTLTASLSESQQLILGFVYLSMWLVVVWLLRNILLNKQIAVRDGIYAAHAPLISSLLIVGVGVLQLIPLAILVALLSAIASTGAVSSFIIALGAMLILTMAVVTLYWLIGTLFASIIVTIPGTYPGSALRSARQIVKGHRAVVLRRLLWLAALNLGVYIIVIVPIVFLDVLSGFAFSWVTVIIHTALGLGLFIASSSYLYLLYRKIIDAQTT